MSEEVYLVRYAILYTRTSIFERSKQLQWTGLRRNHKRRDVTGDGPEMDKFLSPMTSYPDPWPIGSSSFLYRHVHSLSGIPEFRNEISSLSRTCAATISRAPCLMSKGDFPLVRAKYTKIYGN